MLALWREELAVVVRSRSVGNVCGRNLNQYKKNFFGEIKLFWAGCQSKLVIISQQAEVVDQPVALGDWLSWSTNQFC